jgi:hypothetical protein
MNTTRLLKLIIIPILALSAIGASLAFSTSNGVKTRPSSYMGIGDLRHLEAQSSISVVGGLLNTGMADWRRFESQQSVPAHRTHKNLLHAGMGDLHYFEALQR